MRPDTLGPGFGRGNGFDSRTGHEAPSVADEGLFMGQYTRWIVTTSAPVQGLQIDDKKLYDSRGDAVLAAYRIATTDQSIKLQRDRVLAHAFMETLSNNGRAKYRDVTWYVRSVEPVYFKVSEENSE